jgi:cytochrome c biogenesis factor
MYLEIYLNVIFCVKVYVLYFAIQNNLHPSETYAKKRDQAERWFNILMALLLLYLFHPMSKNPVFVNRETKIYMFIFAVLTLIHQPI